MQNLNPMGSLLMLNRKGRGSFWILVILSVGIHLSILLSFFQTHPKKPIPQVISVGIKIIPAEPPPPVKVETETKPAENDPTQSVESLPASKAKPLVPEKKQGEILQNDRPESIFLPKKPSKVPQKNLSESPKKTHELPPEKKKVISNDSQKVDPGKPLKKGLKEASTKGKSASPELSPQKHVRAAAIKEKTAPVAPALPPSFHTKIQENSEASRPEKSKNSATLGTRTAPKLSNPKAPTFPTSSPRAPAPTQATVPVSSSLANSHPKLPSGGSTTRRGSTDSSSVRNTEAPSPSMEPLTPLERSAGSQSARQAVKKAELSQESTEKTARSYNHQLQSIVRQNLYAPKQFSSDLVARIEVAINPDGSLYHHRIRQSSGSAAFDLAVSTAIQTSNFPPLPAKLSEAPPYIVVIKISP